MSEELIDKYVDRAAITSDTDFLVGKINDAEQAYVKLKAITTELRNAPGLNSISTLNSQGATALQNFNSIARETISINQKQSAGFEQLIKKFNDAKSLLKSNTELQKELTKQVEAGAISADEYRLKLTQLTASQLKYKQVISETGKELKDFSKLQFTVPGSIGEAQAQNKQLLSIQKRIPVNETEKLAEVNKLIDRNNQLIDENSDKLSRQKIQIGNYAGSLKDSFSLLQNEIKRLNGVLGDGKSGPQGFIDPAQAQAARQQIAELDKVLVSASRSGLSTVQVVRSLETGFSNLATNGNVSKEFLQKYEQSVVAAKNSIVTLGGETENTAKKGAGFTNFLSKAWTGIRSLAYAIPGLGIAGVVALLFVPFQKLYEFITKDTDAIAKLKRETQLLSDVSEEAGKASGSQVASLRILKDVLNDVSKSEKERLEAVKVYNELADKSNQINAQQINDTILVNSLIERQIQLIEKKALSKAFENKLGEAANKIVEIQNKIDLSEQGREVTRLQQLEISKRNTSDYVSLIQQRILAERELRAERPGDFADLEKANNEFNELLNLSRKYIDFSDLAKIKADKANKGAKEAVKSLSQLLDIEFEIYKTNNERQLRLIEEFVNDENDSLDDRIHALERFYFLKNQLDEAEFINQKNKIQLKLQEDIKNANGNKKEIEILQINAAKQISLIEEKSYDQRLKNDEEFLKKKKKMVDDYQKDAIKKGEEAGKKEAEAEGRGYDEERAKYLRKRESDIKNAQQSLYGELAKLNQAFFDGEYERRKQAIDKEKSLLDADAAAQIDRITKSTLSEQEKADKIALINAKAQVKREELDKKQRQLDYRKAQFDRALALFEITIGIAKAVASHIKTPYLIPFDLAIGAAQIAAVLARPIPRFFKGKNAGDKYEGPAITNDGGQLEPIFRADTGEVEISPRKDNLTFVGKDDIVYPSVEAMMRSISTPQLKTMKAKDATTAEIIRSEMAKQNRLLTMIANKPNLKLGATDKGMTALWNWGANQTRYVDENTNW